MTLLAISLTEAPLLLIKGLAVIAGVFVGAFFLGLFVRLLVRLFRPKPMPGWAGLLVRLGGAAAGGFGTWLLVANLQWFGGGGSGDGNDNGMGKDRSKTEEVKKDATVKPEDKVEPPKDGDKTPKEEKPLHVFVLGLKDLKNRLKTDAPNIDNCYWIEGDPNVKLRDLEGLKKEIRLRREKDKKLKVYMDTTENSPDRFNPYYWVPLEVWLRDEKILSQKP